MLPKTIKELFFLIVVERSDRLPANASESGLAACAGDVLRVHSRLMHVHLSDVPEEGLHLAGELPASIFELSPSDPIRPTGPVRYEANIHAFDEAISIHGRLAGPFELQCGACLEYFPYEADFADWTSELDREPDQEGFDLAVLVREDFLLNLPSHPRCDDFVDGRICPRAHLFDADGEEDGSDADGKAAGSGAWDALDDWK